MPHQITWPIACVLMVVFPTLFELIHQNIPRRFTCKHNPVERTRSVIHPVALSVNMAWSMTAEEKASAEKHQRLMNGGSTTILFVCSKCGVMEQRTLPGVVLGAVSVLEKD